MDTRKFDLLELMEERRNAKSLYERERVERVIARIAAEGGEIRTERERLIEAVRGNDKRAVRYFQERINRIVQNKTGGRYIS